MDQTTRHQMTTLGSPVGRIAVAAFAVGGLSAALVAPTQALPESEARTGTRPKPVPQRVETRYQSWPERGHKKDLVQSLGSGGSTLRSSVRKGSALRSDRWRGAQRTRGLDRRLRCGWVPVMRRMSSSHVSKNTRKSDGGGASIEAKKRDTIPKPDGLEQPAAASKSNRDRTQKEQRPDVVRP